MSKETDSYEPKLEPEPVRSTAKSTHSNYNNCHTDHSPPQSSNSNNSCNNSIGSISPSETSSVGSGSGLVSASFLPHGSMILNVFKQNPKLPQGAAQLHRATSNCANQIARHSPTLVIVMTPHGICEPGKASIYLPIKNHDSQASGTAEWRGDWYDYRVSLTISSHYSHSLFNYINNHFKHNNRKQTDSNINPNQPKPNQNEILTFTEKTEKLFPIPEPVMINCFGGIHFPLRWAEVVPIHFLLNAMADPNNHKNNYLNNNNVNNNQKASTNYYSGIGKSENSLGLRADPSLVKFIFIDTPRANLIPDESEQQKFRSTQMEYLTNFGQVIRSWCDLQVNERIALIVSGDLAHTHDYLNDSSRGYENNSSNFSSSIYDPMPSSNFTFSSKAQPFDHAAQLWAQTRISQPQNQECDFECDSLLNEMNQLESEAKSCGFSGLVLLNSILKDKDKWIHHKDQFYYAKPSYFGMMCATYSKK